MKKFGAVLLGAVSWSLLTMVTAFADSVVTPPDVGGEVVRPPGAGEGVGGLSFTGGEVTVWMVLSVGLLLAGVALLIAGRRRRSAALSE